MTILKMPKKTVRRNGAKSYRPSAKVCGRSRRYRDRLLPRYWVQRMSRDAMVCMHPEALEWTIEEMLENFRRQLRVHEFALKRPYRIELWRDYDIDYNAERFVMEQRLHPRR